MDNTLDWLDPVFVTYEQFASATVAYLPTLGSAFVVLMLGLLMASFLKRLVLRISGAATGLLYRFTGPRTVPLGRLPWPLSTIVANLVYWLTIVFFLTVTIRVLGLPGIAEWIAAAVSYLPRALAAIIVIAIGYSLASVLRDAINRLASEESVQGHRAIAHGAFLLVNLIAIIVGTDQLGIDLSLLQSIIVIVVAAMVGGMAFAFGLGAGSSIDNVIAGYYVQKTYRPGQRIRIKGMDGEVLDIKPTAVVIDSPSGRAMIPAKLFNQEVSILLDAEEEKL